MFSSLDVLYIVLAFCVLWITIGLFWLIWQISTMLKRVNETLDVAREKIVRIEQAMTAIRGRVEHATSSGGLIVEGIKKVVEFALEKRRERTNKPQETDVYEDK